MVRQWHFVSFAADLSFGAWCCAIIFMLRAAFDVLLEVGTI